jgi:hypothetical protein
MQGHPEFGLFRLSLPVSGRQLAIVGPGQHVPAHLFRYLRDAARRASKLAAERTGRFRASAAVNTLKYGNVSPRDMKE